MNDSQTIKSHYLAISYKALVNKNIIHFFLFFIEIALIFLQIIEIYYNSYNSFKEKNNKYFSPLTYLQLIIEELPELLKFFVYPIIIIIIIITSYLYNHYRFKINIITKIMINILELLYYRILSLFLFNYLFIFKDIYLIINIIFTLPYILILVSNFCNCHLYLFFPSFISYPYDSFSMVIDLHLLFVKIFISLSRMGTNKNISKFSFILSIFFIFILLIYLSYIMINKSYYLMNNIHLNNARFGILLSICISTLIALVINKNKLLHIYFIICLCNIFLLSLILVSAFYNPYKFAKFDKDNNIENVYYYFFMFDKDKNYYFLIEEKIEEHISKCNMCNLCKKYNIIKNIKDKNQIDLFKIIYNEKNYLLNLFNIIIRKIKKNGKNSFMNNSYFLINIIYTYSLTMNHRNNNILLNIELIFDIINSDNIQLLEENQISLRRIKYTNDFFIKANRVINDIYYIFEEKRIQKIIRIFFKLGEEIEKFKYKEIKSNLNNNSNYSTGVVEGQQNYNNLISICSLFYEELFNETISNSGISIRENPNSLEELINNVYKLSKHITLEVDNIFSSVKIIRAGGEINKYENCNFQDLFLKIFKNQQIFEMKNVLLNSNNMSYIKTKKNIIKEHKLLKGIEKEKQYINFNFLIEEKENDEIFCKLLKLKMCLILLNHINNKIYLNGVYILNNDILLSEETKNEEKLLYFGNKKQIKICMSKNNITNINNKIIIKKNKNEKYLGNEKLIKITCFNLILKKYNIYHFIISKKKSIYKKLLYNNDIGNNLKEEHIELLETNNNNSFIFNDLASHASSGNNSMARNTLISYNREIKKIHQNEYEAKELKIIRYILLLVITLFLIILIILSILLNKSHQIYEKAIYFYLTFSDYSNMIYNLFFSTLSLSCIVTPNSAKNCTNYFSDLPALIIKKIFPEYMLYIYNDSDFEYMKSIIQKDYIDFSQFLYYQNKILIENSNNEFNSLIKNLTKFNDNTIINIMKNYITHFKINQNYLNGNIVLTLSEENITFSDFNLLLISRFSSLSNNYSDIFQPIYLLNKTGDYTFNNFIRKTKLSAYQQSFYLNILDFQKYSTHLGYVVREIELFLLKLKMNFKILLYLFLNLFLLFIIVIFIILFSLIFIYSFLIIKTLNQINSELKEKINETTVKDILRRKIDNLKSLLKFYDNDINKIINKLNKIYDEYKDNYNMKLKEELKILKREGKKEFEKANKNFNCMKAFSTIKKYKLYKYVFRKKSFLYLFLLIVILTFAIYFINLFLWIFTFQKDLKIMEWKSINSNIISTTNRLISTYFLMIFNNQTLYEMSIGNGSNDFISNIFSELSRLYTLEKYNKYINNNYINIIKENDNCEDFFKKLDNDIFIQLYNKYIDEEEKFIKTMSLLCNWSFIFNYRNYKAIYLKFFSLVQKGIEFYKNNNYKDLINYISKKEVIQIDIIYLTIHKYIIDTIIQNNKEIFILMIHKIGCYIIITNSILYPLIFLLIFVTFFIYIRTVNNEYKRFVHIKKMFKVSNIN